MKETISITIAGAEYTVRAEDAEYTKKVAAHLDYQISEILRAGNIPIVEAAILAGMNVGDEYYKVLETSDELRATIKDQLEEITRLKAEIERLKQR